MSKNKVISKAGLGVVLSRLKGFDKGEVRAEQYLCDSEIGAFVLYQAFYSGKVSVRTIADLGCGTGILGIGALILGAKKVYFVDSDENSLKIAKSNLEYAKSEGLIDGEAKFICSDVEEFNEKVDTVIMNPPFGVKVRHADRIFLGKAMEIANSIYSFHKSESDKFVRAFGKDNGFEVRGVFDFDWPLKATMVFHRRRIKKIKVSCFVLERV